MAKRIKKPQRERKLPLNVRDILTDWPAGETRGGISPSFNDWKWQSLAHQAVLLGYLKYLKGSRFERDSSFKRTSKPLPPLAFKPPTSGIWPWEFDEHWLICRGSPLQASYKLLYASISEMGGRKGYARHLELKSELPIIKTMSQLRTMRSAVDEYVASGDHKWKKIGVIMSQHLRSPNDLAITLTALMVEPAWEGGRPVRMVPISPELQMQRINIIRNTSDFTHQLHLIFTRVKHHEQTGKHTDQTDTA